MTVQVHVYAQASAEAAPEVELAYHEISKILLGTPGLIRNTLFADAGTPGRYLVVSEWTDMAAFQAWETGPDHRVQTAPLRPYLDPGPSGRRFSTVAAYTNGALADSHGGADERARNPS